MTQRAPLVVILGATACGKSRLAIELAQKFKGEIISADSMQVYRGLDIVTNKVTEEEQQQATHHMINFVDPLNRYSVIDFRNKSLDLINRLHKQHILPIVVGGTNYYIESLLWRSFILGPTLESAKRAFEDPDCSEDDTTLIDSEAKLLGSTKSLHTQEDLEDVDKFLSKPIYNDGFSHIDSEKLWHILERLDPRTAHLFHPHDKRRLIRCLQVIQESKKNYSELLKEKNVSEFGEKASLGGPLRYPSTLVIWLHCDNELLNKVLDDRVDRMLDRGLLAELESFHNEYNKQRLVEGRQPEYDKGIFQTIGFKEFHEYLMMEPDARHSDKGNEVLRAAIERMKISTRQYAKRQIKWIKRRFLQSGTRDLPPLFKFETSFDREGWIAQVQKPASDIVSHFLNDREITKELMTFKRVPQKLEATNKPGKYDCEVCGRVFIGSHYIDQHLNSRVHLKNLTRSKRMKERLGFTSASGSDTHVQLLSTTNEQ